MPHSGTGTPDSADRGIGRAAGPARVGDPGRRMLGPGLPAQPVIHFALGRRQVTMTDRNEQSVINSLQSAHIADYESVGSEYRSAPEGAQILQFGRLDRVK
jgi:hypothetical protein